MRILCPWDLASPMISGQISCVTSACFELEADGDRAGPNGSALDDESSNSARWTMARARLLITGFSVVVASCALADPAITTRPVVMRAAPSAKAHLVQNVPPNAAIDLNECTGGWCYVSWRNLFGYLPADALAAQPYTPGYYGPPPVVVGPGWGWGPGWGPGWYHHW
jgi:hypothetical protein